MLRPRLPRSLLHLPVAAALLPLAGHAQFTLQDSNTTSSLRGISAPGNGVAWASGTGGTVLRTEDGGYVWQGCAVPPGGEKLDFRGIQAFDGQTALVMSSGKGDLSRVYKTTDGCRTWKLVFTNPDAEGFFDAMSFAPLRRGTDTADKAGGYLLGDPVAGYFVLFSTGDGGSSWNRWTGAKRDDKNVCAVDSFAAGRQEASFAASNQALVGVFRFPMFVTGGGTSRFWSVDQFDLDYAFCHIYAESLKLDLVHGAESEGGFALAIQDEGDPSFMQMVAVGGDYKHPESGIGTAVLIESKSGFHVPFSAWFKQEAAKTPPHGYRSSVAYDAPSKTWITVGPNGTDVSRDDGRHWSPLRPGKDDAPDADRDWNALALPFVVGPHGRIGRLRDDALRPTPPNPR